MFSGIDSSTQVSEREMCDEARFAASSEAEEASIVHSFQASRTRIKVSLFELSIFWSWAKSIDCCLREYLICYFLF